MGSYPFGNNKTRLVKLKSCLKKVHLAVYFFYAQGKKVLIFEYSANDIDLAMCVECLYFFLNVLQ